MNPKETETAGDLSPLPWLEVLHPDVRLGMVRHTLFDFDGTLSVIRRGWEHVMIPLMVEMILDGASVPAEIEAKIEAEASEYVDRSTGILTIKQMRWLEEAVRRCGWADSPKTARAYKRIYNERLLRPVRARMSQLDGSREARDGLMIAGARRFLDALSEREVTLYLVSGTDHEYVVEEASALGITPHFGEHIYGARDDTTANTKSSIIQGILADDDLQGEQLLVVGDGPVEIRNAKARGAVALGVAADEEEGKGLDPRKRKRLLSAGVDLLVTDFLHAEELAQILVDVPGLRHPSRADDP